MTDYPYGETGSFFPEETPPTPPQNEKGKQSSHLSLIAGTAFDYVELAVITVCIILFVTLFLLRHTVVDGNSMNATLENGEHLIITDLFYTPDAGDIVVFESVEETGLGKPLIKRVVATEGQIVCIDKNGVWVDGILIASGSAYLSYNNGLYANRANYGKAVLAPESGEDGICYRYEVGEGQVFVMGDNRFDSLDSRVFGPVSEDCILGHVVLRIIPFSKFGGVD